MQLMKRNWIAVCALSTAAFAQVQNFKPVTEEMLKNPSPNDWLSFSRTQDAQRFSPLTQIDRGNVSKLGLAWSRGIGTGNTESIPIVHDGVMYVIIPGGNVQALNATNGDLLWEYNRKAPANVASTARSKTIAIYQDIVAYTSPDGFVVGLDARTGEKRWETYAGEANQTSGPVMANGKVITGRACARTRESCFIAAHDALTGKELWKFYTVPGPGEPGYESWGSPSPETHAKNMASAWGLLLRSRAQSDLLGRRQSDAEHARGPARWESGCNVTQLAIGPLQQFHLGDQSGYRQACLVLPTSAGRRLG